MTRIGRLGMVAVIAVAVVAAPAFGAVVTVGRFYTELAQAKHLVSADAVSAEANLRGAGFNLPKLSVDKSLTEGDMTAISNALGVFVKTERPSQPISESLLNTYLSVFGGQLRSHGKIGQPSSANGDRGDRGDDDEQGDDRDDDHGDDHGDDGDHHHHHHHSESRF